MLTAPATALMNRFGCAKKMLLISLAFIIPLVTTFYFLVSEQMIAINFAQKEHRGLEYIIPLRQLIQHFPEHRGMTNAFLAGNNEFKEKILAKRRQIAEDIKQINEIDLQIGAELDASRQWNAIKSNWKQLEVAAFNGSSKQIFSQHTRLIADVLELVKHVADTSNLTLDPKLDSYYLMDTIISILPQMAENLGQARGLASGFAVKRSFNQQQRIKLTSLLSTVQQNIAALKRGSQVLFRVNPDVFAQVNNDITQALSLSENYLQLLEREILSTEQINITSTTVFQRGTETIKVNFQLLDHLVPELDALLQQRKDDYYNKMIMLSILVISMLLLAIYFFSGFYQSFMAAITKLKAASSQLASGNLATRLHVENKDEFAEVAQSFNSMAGQFRDVIQELEISIEQMASAAEQMSVTSEQSTQGALRQEVEIEQVAAGMTEMAATTQEVALSAQSTAQATQIAHTNASSGAEVINKTVQAINVLSEEFSTATDAVQNLANDSEKIGSVLDVIRSIAEQTNLLALNAAIEAARAGEQGRGFAVVADEVRTLASRTQESTQEIQEMIEHLQSGATTAVNVMQAGQKRTVNTVEETKRESIFLTGIIDSITEIDDMCRYIASASEQQSSVAESMSQNVEHINQVTHQTAQGSQQISENSANLALLSSNIRKLIGRFKVAG